MVLKLGIENVFDDASTDDDAVLEALPEEVV